MGEHGEHPKVPKEQKSKARDLAVTTRCRGTRPRGSALPTGLEEHLRRSVRTTWSENVLQLLQLTTEAHK